MRSLTPHHRPQHNYAQFSARDHVTCYMSQCSGPCYMFHVTMLGTMLHVTMLGTMLHVTCHNVWDHDKCHNAWDHFTCYNAWDHVTCYNARDHVTCHNAWPGWESAPSQLIIFFVAQLLNATSRRKISPIVGRMANIYIFLLAIKMPIGKNSQISKFNLDISERKLLKLAWNAKINKIFT